MRPGEHRPSESERANYSVSASGGGELGIIGRESAGERHGHERPAWIRGGDGGELQPGRDGLSVATAPVPPRGLYPEIEPYRTGRLRVSELHELYFEESRQPGGQAGRVPPRRARRRHRAEVPPLLRSRGLPHRPLRPARLRPEHAPRRALEDNTTWHLVADIEALRAHLGIERWQVFGGSWGSTLALAYAETHPERVTELVLRGIFLLRKQEIDWFYQRGASVALPRRLGGLPRAHPGGRARRPARTPTTGASRATTRRVASAGGAGLERLGGQHELPLPEPRADREDGRRRASRSPSRASSATTS